MVGKIRRESDQTYKQICQLFPMSNRWESGQEESNEWTDHPVSSNSSTPTFTKARRYSIAPEDMLQVQKQAREQGLSILGIYHSHPDHVAEPSECDRELAWPEYAYVIVSVRKGKAVDVQNWALDSEHQFQSEPMNVLPETSPAIAKDRMPMSA